MYLEEIKIKNFRCYKEEIIIPFEGITTIVGKNDAGKSTILEALEIFFNNKTVTIDKEDLSVGSTDSDLEISCTFSDLPDELIIDSDNPTSLKNEYLINENGFLEIKKIYNCSLLKPKESTYIICSHPSKDKYSDLLLLNRIDLNKRATELSINESSYNKTINAEIRKAIWKSEVNLNIEKTEVPVNKEASKKIYETLKNYLPVFNLFQSDRSSNDDDREVTEPMKAAVKNALKAAEKEIEGIKDLVQKEAQETAHRTLQKLSEMNPELARELRTEFRSEPDFSKQFKLSILSDNDIPINKRGSGVRRLILINFFRAEAEKRLSDSVQNSIIYAFEEPETSQHPTHQHMLLDSLIELSEADKTQVIITTHTPPIAKRVPLNGLRLIETNELGYKKISFHDDSVYQKIVDYLGVYPEEVAKGCRAFLFVEGKGDVAFVNHISNELSKCDHISGSLEDNNIAAIPIGGCDNLTFWVEYKLAERYGIPYFVLLDSDLGTDAEIKQRIAIENLKKDNILAIATRKREIENYLHKDIVGFDVSETEDAKVTISQANGISKRKIFDAYLPKMTSNLIREVECYDDNGCIRYEFSDFFNEIIQRTNSYS